MRKFETVATCTAYQLKIADNLCKLIAVDDAFKVNRVQESSLLFTSFDAPVHVNFLLQNNRK